MKGRGDVDDDGQGSFAHYLDGSFQEIYCDCWPTLIKRESKILELETTVTSVIVIR